MTVVNERLTRAAAEIRSAPTPSRSSHVTGAVVVLEQPLQVTGENQGTLLAAFRRCLKCGRAYFWLWTVKAESFPKHPLLNDVNMQIQYSDSG